MKVHTAMILCAGRGERMRPLTDHRPKPLLEVKGKPLIDYHLQKLFKAGIKRVVVNNAWLGEQIVAYLGNGNKYGMEILHSREETALETAGGIVKAMPLLGTDPFLVVNGDIFTDFDFTVLPSELKGNLAHLLLVNNPKHNTKGDFSLCEHQVIDKRDQTFTFSGVALYHPDFFQGIDVKSLPLAPLIRRHIAKNEVGGQLYEGLWCDVGTPQRLQEISEAI